MKKGGLLGFREIAGDGLKAIEVASKLVHKRPTGESLPRDRSVDAKALDTMERDLAEAFRCRG